MVAHGGIGLGLCPIYAPFGIILPRAFSSVISSPDSELDQCCVAPHLIPSISKLLEKAMPSSAANGRARYGTLIGGIRVLLKWPWPTGSAAEDESCRVKVCARELMAFV